MHYPCEILALVVFLGFSNGKTVYHEFDVKYTPGTADGVWKEKILTVNGHLPGPTIEANVGDYLQIVVFNNIQDGQNVSLHFHGLEHRGYPFEDGANLLTQCPLKQGEFQTYFFPVTLAGTYWYHSHVNSQYTEGFWGPIIIHNNVERYSYDGEIVISLSDWYHRSARENEYWHVSMISGGVPPYPDTALLNGLGRYPCPFAERRSFLKNCTKENQKRWVYRVVPEATYRVRLINTGADVIFKFGLDHHKLSVIEVDGVDVIPVEVDEIQISPGQRYSFLVKINGNPGDSFFMHAKVMTEELILHERENLTPYPEALVDEVTARVIVRSPDNWELPNITTEIYDWTQVTTPQQSRPQELRLQECQANEIGQQETGPHEIISLDDSLLLPADGTQAPEKANVQIILNTSLFVGPEGIFWSTFNNIPHKLPHYPLLMTVLENGNIPPDVHPYVVNYNDVVEIVINNPTKAAHPVHLHGNFFWVVGSGPTGQGSFDHTRDKLNLNTVKRDTALVQGHSWTVLKFVADNPGVWTFHCHNAWHHVGGMSATIIAAPEILRQNVTVTDEARRVCKLQGIDLP